jgi:hypothetical protein
MPRAIGDALSSCSPHGGFVISDLSDVQVAIVSTWSTGRENASGRGALDGAEVVGHRWTPLVRTEPGRRSWRNASPPDTVRRRQVVGSAHGNAELLAVRRRASAEPLPVRAARRGS